MELEAIVAMAPTDRERNMWLLLFETYEEDAPPFGAALDRTSR